MLSLTDRLLFFAIIKSVSSFHFYLKINSKFKKDMSAHACIDRRNAHASRSIRQNCGARARFVCLFLFSLRWCSRFILLTATNYNVKLLQFSDQQVHRRAARSAQNTYVYITLWHVRLVCSRRVVVVAAGIASVYV